MAFPKIEMFPEADQAVSYYARVLGYPARVMILRLLRERGAMAVHEIVVHLQLSLGTVTEHLKKLRVAGFVDVYVDRLTNYYVLDPNGLQRHFNVQRELATLLISELSA